jgi:hypothetical protein
MGWQVSGKREMSDFIEVFKVVGAAGGLISACFLLYDRLMRIRPEAFLSKGEYPGHLNITVRNVSNESIILDEIGVSPNILGAAEGDGVHAIVEAIHRRGDDVAESSRDVFIVLKPLEELRLKVVTFDKFIQAAAGQKVVVRLSWRTTRDRMPFKRNIKIRTSVADIQAMTDGSQRVE